MKIFPRRTFLFVVLLIASAGRADAQGLQGLLDFLSTLDFQGIFNFLCPFVNPFFEGLGFSLCGDGGGTDDDGGTDDGTDDGGPAPVPAPTKKKITSEVAAPVAPPAAAP
jgi:hypothetical protein